MRRGRGVCAQRVYAALKLNGFNAEHGYGNVKNIFGGVNAAAYRGIRADAAQSGALQKLFVPLRAVIGADVKHVVNIVAFVQKFRRNIRMSVWQAASGCGASGHIRRRNLKAGRPV